MKIGNTTKPCPLKERFWEKVDVRRPDECWFWLASKDQYGYGQISIDGNIRRATHVLFYLRHNYWPPKGKQANHTCDNPPCMNPRHLYLGTKKSNTRDMMQRKRNRTFRGEHNGRSKLTEKQVQEIRVGLQFQNKLAEKYGVAPSTISRIKAGKRWC